MVSVTVVIILGITVEMTLGIVIGVIICIAMQGTRGSWLSMYSTHFTLEHYKFSNILYIGYISLTYYGNV